jgi:tripeptidyl-peptidase-1
MMGVAGTSASCPVFAGIVARLNAARTAAGKPQMGWLNPWIYANPQMFQDVTEGTNGAGQEKGFPATAGWDPSSGFGTADFAKMLHAAMQAAEVDTLVV